MKEILTRIIAAIVENKKSNKKSPDHALLLEVTKAVSEETKKTLNKMYKNKEIIVGNTLNDKWIKLNNKN